MPSHGARFPRDHNSEPIVYMDRPGEGRYDTPALESPLLRIARLSGPSLTEGIETHLVEGVSVRVYSAAKTIADCFKFRNKIGLDIAIEALRDCLSQRKASINDIHRYAKICRVSNVIRPYMEAL